MDQINQILRDFSCRCSIEVQWGDMDAAQHVNNIIYLRWGETARIKYLQDIGWDNISGTHATGVILAYQNIKYLFPLTFPDTVEVGLRVTETGDDRFNMLCHMVSHQHQRLVAISNYLLVTYDYKQLQKVPVPKELQTKIQNFEKGL